MIFQAVFYYFFFFFPSDIIKTKLNAQQMDTTIFTKTKNPLTRQQEKTHTMGHKPKPEPSTLMRQRKNVWTPTCCHRTEKPKHASQRRQTAT